MDETRPQTTQNNTGLDDEPVYVLHRSLIHLRLTVAAI